MIKFSKEKVLLLHKLIAQETGGSIGVRDEALLDSALENAFAGFGGQEFYPTKEEKGARLGYTLISNHAFVDGNKRIGMYVMLTFLEVNGIRLECTNEEVVEVGLAVASGTMDYDALLQWVRAYAVAVGAARCGADRHRPAAVCAGAGTDRFRDSAGGHRCVRLSGHPT